MKESFVKMSQELSSELINQKLLKDLCLYQLDSDDKYDNNMVHKVNRSNAGSRSSVTSSYSVSEVDPSDSQSDDDKKQKSRERFNHELLPPIGVFWDIENCQIPRGKSAISVAQEMRSRFFSGYKEAEFLVVCDVTKEKPIIVQELNYAQVNVIHVNAMCKNAADEKLRQSIRKFADIHSRPAAILIITGDINFSADLSDLRHSKKVHVILLHPRATSEALILCANEHHSFSELVENVPLRGSARTIPATVEVMVTNLPSHKNPSRVKSRIKRLCENSGGKVGFTTSTECSIRFPAMESAMRAKKRMDGEDVFGNKIQVSEPIVVEDQQTTCSTTRGHSTNRSQLVKTPVVYNNNLTNARSPKVPNVDAVSYNKSTPAPPAAVVVGGGGGGEGTVHQGKQETHNGEHDHCCNELSHSNLKGSDRTNRCSYYERMESYRQMEAKKHNNVDSNNVKMNNSSLSDATSDLRYNQNTKTEFEESPENVQMLPVELKVTGLNNDSSKDFSRNVVTNLFKEYVEVEDVSLFYNQDRHRNALVRLKTIRDCLFVITKLKGYRLHDKIINIVFYKNHTSNPVQVKRLNAAQIFSEQQQNKMNLLTFLNLYSSRYESNLNNNDFNHMRDFCWVTGGDRTKYVYWYTTSDNLDQDWRKVKHTCFLHGSSDTVDKLPNVTIRLKTLSVQIHILLQNHDGSLPLSSLLNCYNSTFEPMQADNQGVALEHLVSCVPGVEIIKMSNVKYVRWMPVRGETVEINDYKLQTLSQEITQMLLTRPKCVLPFEKFGQEYLQMFNKYCRIADYGFSRFEDLIDSLAASIQVLGGGADRMLTLTHKYQTNRFKQDWDVLCNNVTEQSVTRQQFMELYWRTFNRTWDPCSYGLGELNDVLEIVNSSVFQDKILIPKNNVTDVQIKQIFRNEIRELLMNSQNYSTILTEFNAHYIQYFKRSPNYCNILELVRKNNDLFNLICDTSRNATIRLSINERLKILKERLSELLYLTPYRRLSLSQIIQAYPFQYNSPLLSQDYDSTTLSDLIRNKLQNDFKLEESVNGPELSLAACRDKELLTLRVRRVLLHSITHEMTQEHFIQTYNILYNARICNFDIFVSTVVPQVVLLKESKSCTTLCLTDVQKLAHELYMLLVEHGGYIRQHQLQQLYLSKYHKPLTPGNYHYQTVRGLLSAISDTVRVDCGKYLCLNTRLKDAGFSVPLIKKVYRIRDSSDEGDDDDSSSSDDVCLKQLKPKPKKSITPSPTAITSSTTSPVLNITAPDPSELPTPASLVNKTTDDKSNGISKLAALFATLNID